jgi:hypothetical protein
MCYRDRTFCVSPNCQNKCGSKLTDEIREAARQWWGGEDAPIAVAEICDEHGEPRI